MEQKEKNFALLIDADNISAKYIKLIIDELSQYGNITFKRIYGDWTSTNQNSWKGELLANSITPIQQFSYTTGKNATDSAMIIDAMDILYSKDVDGFCIVSSDSDFTRLASRLRESGKMVIGMGEKKTPDPFRKACDVFTALELLDEAGKDDPDVLNISTKELEKYIVAVMIENQNNSRKTGLGEIGSRLLKRYPDFDVRSYGYTSLSTFLEQEFKNVELVKEGNLVTVLLKSDKNTRKEVQDYITRVLIRCGKNGKDLAVLGNEVYAKFPNFRAKDYGYAQFKSYIKSIPGMKVKKEGNISKAYRDN